MHILPLESNRHLLPDVATVAARAFTYDNLFLWLRPYVEGASLTPTPPGEPARSPPPALQASRWFAHLRGYFVVRLRAIVASAQWRSFVAVSEPGDEGWEGRPEVLGHACWYREFGEGTGEKEGEGGVGREERRAREELWGRDSVGMKVERWLVAKERAWAEWVGFDGFYDKGHLKLFADAWEGFHPYTVRVLMELGRNGTNAGDKGSEEIKGLGSRDGYVWLHFLTVDPTMQRRGVGGKLMEWGMKRAEIERVPAGLTASPQGLGLYKKWGFEDVGETIVYADIEDVFMVAWAPDEESS